MKTATEKKATPGKLRSIKYAADRLGVPVWTLQDWIKYRKIESHKLNGRRLISDAEIDRLIEESRQPRDPRARIRIRKNEAAKNQVDTVQVAA